MLIQNEKVNAGLIKQSWCVCSLEQRKATSKEDYVKEVHVLGWETVGDS